MEYASIDLSIDAVVAFIFVLCITIGIIVESVKADRRFKKQWNDGMMEYAQILENHGKNLIPILVEQLAIVVKMKMVISIPFGYS